MAYQNLRKFTSLDQARSLFNDASQAKRDMLVDSGAMRMATDGSMLLQDTFDTIALQFNRSSFAHLVQFLKGTKTNPGAERIGRATSYLWDDCPPDLRSANVNYWLEAIPREYKIRSFGDEIAAIASDRYRVADPDVFLDVLRQVAESANIHFGNNDGDWGLWGHIGPYDLKMRVTVPGFKMTLPEGRVAEGYIGGFYMGTGGTRNRSHYVRPFIQRDSCTNSTIFGGEFGVRHNHSISPDTLFTHLIAGIQDSLSGVGNYAEMMRKAAVSRLSEQTMTDLITAVANKFSLGDDAAMRLFAAAQNQGGNTRLGLSNAITFYAQGLDNFDKREEMEFFGGELIMAETDRALNHAFNRVADLGDSD